MVHFGWCDPKLKENDYLEKLAELLKKSKVKGLDLEQQEIGDAGLEVLAEGLKLNKTLVTLNLTGNGLGPKSIPVLEGVIALNKTLKSVILDENEKLSDFHHEAIAKALAGR